MSQTLAAASTPTVFFTAGTPGVFTLALEGPGLIFKNGDYFLAPFFNGSDWVGSASVFLDTSDTLSYQGSGASITGYRIGNEFEDP